MGKRRTAREQALKFLYQTEFNSGELEKDMESFWEGLSSGDEVREFMDGLVKLVQEHREEIDRFIEQSSKNWTLDRMPHIDRNIIRIAVGELMYRSEVPPKVAINEALEIAKKFGSQDSTDFVNGILDRVKKELEKKAASASTQ